MPLADGAIIQLNPIGMLSTEDGYISSISVRQNGGVTVFTPDANNQIGVASDLYPIAATRLATVIQRIRLVKGGSST